MPTFASQHLIVGNTPIGFDLDLFKGDPYNQPQQATFVVEAAPIRISLTPTQVVSATEGTPVAVGRFTVIATESDIKDFRAVSQDSLTTASLFVEFTTERPN